MKCIDPDEDPLDWWKKSDKSFSILAKLARRYLSPSVTSVQASNSFLLQGMYLITEEQTSLQIKQRS
uniref:HAT C-terminal dimerisation domain-containing protein n=1 Tax=Acrobeloides nanus TaxID=290746 RepID=A0A914CM27_9BILA